MNTSAIRSENNYSKLIDTSLSSDSLIDSDEDDDDENLLQSNNSLFSPINQSGGRSSLQNFGADFSYSVLPEQVLPYSATQKVRMFLPVILFSFWINLMTYYIPGVIPFQVSDDERYFWWNVEFILFPAIGACFVASEKLRVYRVDFLVIIMVFFFIYYLFILFYLFYLFYFNFFNYFLLINFFNQFIYLIIYFIFLFYFMLFCINFFIFFFILSYFIVYLI